MKDFFIKIVEFVDKHNKVIVKTALVILGVILLSLTIFFSANSFSVSSESNKLVDYIEKRNYGEATSYYNKVKEEFSESKMDRFSKSLSKKINKILVNYGDRYIKGEIGKDYFISLINIINELDTVYIDASNIIDQAKRVNDLYLQEKISYKTAMGYIQAVSTLKISKNEIYVYAKKIDVIEDSRKVYNLGVKDQEKKMYKEAISNYDKVMSEDKKYYDLAQDKKEECIKDMYDYYIEKANTENENGNYQQALEYIEYLKQYYLDDDYLNELSSKYEKNLKMYSMTNDEIVALISKKSGMDKADIRTNIFQQMVNGSKYYYVETFVNKDRVDEFLINPRNKKVYSYLDEKKTYKNNYSDGYWRATKDGSVEFTISKNTAISILEKKLKEHSEKYKYVTIEEKNNALKYIENKEQLDKFIGKNNDIYYYAVVNRGFFKSKEVYLINPYTKQIYKVSEDKISKI
ncbi:MAG: UbiD family decarboxylase [Paeniclostridium sp.]|uniref:UbiD family decarboxylase n=2 Tax=Paraclostridium sordellii TaxID=1505 RepID=UPI0012D75724|nr:MULTISPECIES: UbiD family decarboxylase [Paeniclostridium]MBW4863737.1 UbiD family decarboxylase [Paeniclostridium sp.]MBW4872449.1 UbiD family decarboxylase [Paeniclostridium sp.]